MPFKAGFPIWTRTYEDCRGTRLHPGRLLIIVPTGNWIAGEGRSVIIRGSDEHAGCKACPSLNSSKDPFEWLPRQTRQQQFVA